MGAWAGCGRYWTERRHTQVVFSFEHLDNRTDQSDDFYPEGMYILANLAWRAFNRMIIGVEYVPGQRWDRDGTKGYANRLMFTLNYGF